MQSQAEEVTVVQGAQATAQVPAPPAPPPPPGLPEVSTVNPRAMLQAKAQQREVLGEQLSRLLNRREDVLEQMQDPMTSATERGVLEQHLVALNARILDMEQQIQRADMEWAAAAAVPGAARPEVHISNGGPPEEMLILGTIFVGISMVILAGSIARRILRGGSRMVAQIPAAFENRFTRLEQSLDAVAIEVERISEGQRFLTRVFAEQNSRAVGAGVESRPANGVSEGYRGGQV